VKSIALVLNSHSSKFERIFNYTLVGLIILLGIVIISGIFSLETNFRNIFGGIILAYGFLRLWLLSNRYRKERREEQKKE